MKYMKNNFGFTLIELVLVISILGLIGTVTLPLFLGTDDIALDGASRKLESDLRYAQSLATTTGDQYGVRTTTSPTNSTYEVYRLFDNSIVTSPYDHQPMQEDLDVSFDGVFFPNTEHVTFDANGTPSFVSGGGILELENKSGNQKTLTINTLGLVTLQ